MQNMHLELQNYPTRMTWFWKEAVLPAGPTFQASQSRFSLCLLQNNLCAMDRMCVYCYSSWFIWLMILLGNRCHEPSTNVPPIPVGGKSSLHGNFKESDSGQKILETRTDCGHKVLWMIIRSRVRKREESFTPSKLISNNPQKYKDVQKNLGHCNSMSCNIKHRETSWWQLWRLQRFYLAQTGINTELKQSH